MQPAWLPDTVTTDVHRALHYTLLWGLEAMEVRTVGGPANRVPHVNAAKIDAALREQEIAPASLCPGMFEGAAADRAAWLNEVVTFDETLRLADQLGCPRIVVSAFAPPPAGTSFPSGDAVEALRRAADRADRAGRLLAVVNRADMACATGADLAALLDALDAPNARAAWSPADALRAGEDPADGLAALDGRVALVRCADGHVTADGFWEDAVLGAGAIDWAHQVETLRAQGFRGPLSLEVFAEPRPKTGLRSATALIRLLRAARSA